MLILNEKTIREFYSMNHCLEDVEQAFRYGEEGKTVAPIRMSVPHEKMEAETLYMPSYIEPEDYTAVKVVSIFPKNAEQGRKVLQGIILLTDAVTGEHVAMMDASYLTVLRTGASSGVATNYMAKKDARSCAVLGCGTQAIGQLQGVMAVRSLDQILLYNRTVEKAQDFKDTLADLYPDWKGNVSVCLTAEDAIKDADIVICSTKSSTPIFNSAALKEGAHINAIGSYLPHMQEIDSGTLKRSSKVVVDTIEGVLHESGDFLIPIEKGEWDAGMFYGEIGEIVSGKKEGRTNDQEITLYKSVGIGHLDTMVAKSVYEKAMQLNRGEKVSID